MLLSRPRVAAAASRYSSILRHPGRPRATSHLQLRVFVSLVALPARPCAASPLNSCLLLQKTTSLQPVAFRPRTLALAMASTTQQQTRTHAGHSHHSHGDNAYLISANRNDAGVKITRVGLYVNLGMAIVKGIGGYVFNSKALSADAIHSLTDLVSDIMTLATVSLALKPPSERFPSGYGKVESLGSLGVSGMLLTGGFFMGWAAVLSICQQFIPGFDGVSDALGLAAGHHHGHDHSHADLGPNINAAWLAGGSILIKEWLYRATLKIANERKSSVLAANAYHHRVDSLTAFVALLMIAGSNILENASWMDPVGGLVISLMVIQAGLGNTKSAVLELADVGLSEDMKKKVRRAADAEIKSNWKSDSVEVRQVSGIKAGQSYLIDLKLGVPGTWSVEETKRLEDALREYVGSKVRGVKRLRLRFVPQDVGEAGEFIRADVSPTSSPEPESADEHSHDDHDHHHPHTR